MALDDVVVNHFLQNLLPNLMQSVLFEDRQHRELIFQFHDEAANRPVATDCSVQMLDHQYHYMVQWEWCLSVQILMDWVGNLCKKGQA